ncbi:MAG: hypothetical protein H7175_09445 [Burkholderiales bacterium]|nr:hypothetical protein [Anaerolineae bacterium]
MSVIEIYDRQNMLNRRQRWSTYLAIIFGVVAIFIGLNLRDSKLYATTLYTNTRAGINARYP